MKPANNTPRRPRRAGFTLAEVLMTLAILAILLVALGNAVYSATESIKENQCVSTASQTVRATLQRMMRDIRRASAASYDSNIATITLIPPADPNATAQTQVTQIQYQYDSTAKQLNYKQTIAGTTNSYVLCGSGGTLTQFTITTVLGTDSTGHTNVPKNIRVSMTLQIGPESFAVTSSASPRSNQIF